MSKKKKSANKKSVDPTKKFFNPRTRAELWDADYLHTLSKSDLQWYKKFMSEYANASLRVIKDPMIVEYSKINKIGYKRAKKEMLGGGYTPILTEGRPVKGHLHKTKEHVKEIFDDNNDRNNDLFGVTKVNKLLELDLDSIAKVKDIWHESDPELTENVLNRMIDRKKRLRR